MKQKTQRGKPGRKPGKDNKIPITIYIEGSVINSLGDGFLLKGKDLARGVATGAVYQHLKELSVVSRETTNLSRKKD